MRKSNVSATKDLTQGTPIKLILLFTIPVLLGNVLQEIYNVADAIVVGRGIDVNALSAVNSMGNISFLANGFINGLCSGCSIITARRYGANDQEGIRRSVGCQIVIGLLSAVVFTLVLLVSIAPIISLLQTPVELQEYAKDYITIIILGIAATTLYNATAALLRAIGDSRTPMLYLGCCVGLNILLDMLFVLQFHMGVQGAAFATILSQLVSGLGCLLHMIRHVPLLHIKRSDLKLTGEDLWSHIRLGIPMGIQMSVISMGLMSLQYVVNGMGTDAVAAYTVASRIFSFSQIAMMSFGSTMSTYVAQNLGARSFKRIRKGVREGTIASVICGIVIAVVVISFSRQLIGIFLSDPSETIVSNAQLYLSWCCPFLFVLSFLFIFKSGVQALGSGTLALLSGALELVARFVVAISLAGSIGFLAVCLAAPISWIVSAIPLLIAFHVLLNKAEKGDAVHAMDRE